MNADAQELPELQKWRRHRETTAVLGMTIFLASWAMLFAALFFAYAMTRARALAWPPADLPALPRLLPACATLAIAVSSAALIKARRRSADASIVVPLLLAAAGAGVFLAIQITVWRTLYAAGLRPETGTYASVFYGLTTFHAVHVLVGIVGLGCLLPGALRAARTADPRDPIPLRLWATYFHLVAVLWLLLFVGVYCL
jgi:heme/copper-type cytochrome/quinol oxidase subunit 3